MTEELIDRFGDIPKKVEMLLTVAGIKALAHRVYVTSIEQKGETYTFTVYERAKVHPERIPDMLKEYKGELSFKADVTNPCFVYEKKRHNKKEKQTDILDVVKKILISLKGLIDE